VGVTGPNGYTPATLVSATYQSRNSWTVRYRVAAPGGAWDWTDNGVYHIQVADGSVADCAGNLIVGKEAAYFDVSLPAPPPPPTDPPPVPPPPPPPVDATPPSATFDSTTEITAGALYVEFVVNYMDELALDPATFDVDDVLVVGPGAFQARASEVSAWMMPGIPGWARVTYRVAAPGGSWGWEDDGRYTVSLAGAQVSDAAGNSAAAGELFAFEVALPQPVPPPAEVPASPPAPPLLQGTASVQRSTPAGSPAIIHVLAEALNPSGMLDAATLALEAGPGNGAVTFDADAGLLFYTPAGGFSGTDTFSYRIGDGAGTTSELATVMVNVLPPLATVTAKPPSRSAAAPPVTDADGTVLTISLKGRGTATVFNDSGRITIRVDGTDAGGSLSIKPRGGNGFADVEDIIFSSPVKAIQGPRMTLDGLLSAPFVGSLQVGEITGGTVAAGGLSAVQIMGSLTGARVLAGLASLGSDGAVGGEGAAGDTWQPAVIKSLKVGGAVSQSVVAAGLNRLGGGPADDSLLTASAIQAVSIGASMDDLSRVIAPALPKAVRIHRAAIATASDHRFRIAPEP
jgi:hypothetical protein